MSDSPHLDNNWSLPLPMQPELHMIPPHRIRPDDRHERQFYLESFSKVQQNRVLGILAQAIESDDGESVSTSVHEIFEKNIPTSEEIYQDKKPQFYVDEVASKLYLSFRGAKQDRRGEKPFHLFISPLSFGEPDRFGHRRVTLSDEPGQMYRINFGDIVIKTLLVFPHPKTGELLLFVIGQDDKMFLQANGKLDLNGAQRRTIDAQILAKFNFGLHYMTDMCSVRFMNKGERLAVFNWSVKKLMLNNNNQVAEKSLVQMYSVDGGKFKLVHFKNCDQLVMVAYISPASRLELNSSENTFPELVRRGIDFVGHVFKYTVFSCPDGVALVKNFHSWIEADLCQTKTKRSFLSFKAPNLFWENRPVSELTLSVQFVLGSILYFIIKMNNERTLHRLDFGGQFKDYRTCAYCCTKETNKRHNDQGKRIAKFKVCRECKKLNLHHQWWKFPCHYCSFQCVKKGWKHHKKMHTK